MPIGQQQERWSNIQRSGFTDYAEVLAAVVANADRIGYDKSRRLSVR